jgi:two-component system, OmpR family, KDP operon response regulator KdpE
MYMQTEFTMAPNKTILIIDEDLRLRTYVKVALQREQFEVLDFPNALEALSALGQIGPAISAIITDIDIRGPEGLKFVRAVTKRLPDMPLLIISRQRPEALDARVSFLSRPFGQRALLEAVRQLC